MRQGSQMDELVKITVEIHNLADHEKLRSINKRITVPSRVHYAQEILADGLGNSFSKNIIQNNINEYGNNKVLLKFQFQLKIDLNF